MKSILKIAACILLSGMPIFISCKKYCDQPPRNYGDFRIVSRMDGKDLVFGANKVYDKNRFKFYFLKGQDTTFLIYTPVKSSGIGYDSLVGVDLSWDPETAYMRLSDGDVDTFNITYQRQSSRCGNYTTITSFRYNNLLVIPQSNGVYELKK
ncbi:MAG: hypothetical protein WKF85_12045 [Chitinophagaceae bacterium]